MIVKPEDVMNFKTSQTNTRYICVMCNLLQKLFKQQPIGHIAQIDKKFDQKEVLSHKLSYDTVCKITQNKGEFRIAAPTLTF